MAKKKETKKDIEKVVTSEDVELNENEDIVEGEEMTIPADAIIDDEEIADESEESEEEIEEDVEDGTPTIKERPIINPNLSGFRQNKIKAAWERETGQKW